MAKRRKLKPTPSPPTRVWCSCAEPKPIRNAKGWLECELCGFVIEERAPVS
jgi:hypothetical protein